MNERKYFLAIGIDGYRDSNISPLNNAVKDVNDFISLLTSSFGFKSENIKQLYNNSSTKSNIFTVFKKWRTELTNLDTLIIYYSGHGHFDPETGIGYWIPYDAILGDESTYIDNSSIIQILLKPLKSKHIVLFSDSCFSGSLLLEDTTRGEMRQHHHELIKRKSRWAIVSGRHDEKVSDGKPGENSPFAKSILKTLESGDAPLSVTELFSRVINETANQSYQLPECRPIIGVGHQGGEFVFMKELGIPYEIIELIPDDERNLQDPFDHFLLGNNYRMELIEVNAFISNLIGEKVMLEKENTEILRQLLNNKVSEKNFDEIKRSYDEFCIKLSNFLSRFQTEVTAFSHKTSAAYFHYFKGLKHYDKFKNEQKDSALAVLRSMKDAENASISALLELRNGLVLMKEDLRTNKFPNYARVLKLQIEIQKNFIQAMQRKINFWQELSRSADQEVLF